MTPCKTPHAACGGPPFAGVRAVLHLTPGPPLARSVIIRTFFNLIFGTIVFSLAIGLVLMPVVLSLVGPPPVRGGARGMGTCVHPMPGGTKGEQGSCVHLMGGACLQGL